MQAPSPTASLVLLFCFHFENLVIFAVYPTLCYGGSLLFYFLFDSSVFAKRSVIY